MTTPIRLDHVKKVVGDVFAAEASDLAADRIIWIAKRGTPRPPRPYVSLQFLTGPFSDVTKEERRFREVIDTAMVTVDTATVGARYRFRANGFPVDYTAVGGDTVTDIRDGLLANAALATNLVVGEDISFAASGADAIDITPDSPGELVSVTTPSAELSLGFVQSDAWVTYTVARDIMTIQVTSFDSPEALDEDATSAKMLCRRFQKTLDAPDTQETLDGARMGMRRISNIVDLSGLETGGAMIEGQSQFDIEVTASSLHITEVVPIDSVETTLDISGDQTTFTTP